MRSSPIARGQSAATGTGRRHPPFAKAGTPRQTERIRFFDVKHIKAKLAVDTENHKVSGVVTHTISPLHPFLSQIELDCGPDLKVTKVTAGTGATPCTFGHKQGKLTIKLDGLTGRMTRSTWPSSIRARRRAGFTLSSRRPAIRRRRCRSGPRASQRIRGAGFRATTIPNERATSEMIITVPKPLFVLSNGVLVETGRMRAGRRLTTGRWTCPT